MNDRPNTDFSSLRMNYSAEETLRIELPWYTRNGTDQEFSIIEKCDVSHIKSLNVQQDHYDGYLQYYYYYVRNSLVLIPETISRLVALETIKIDACIEELPVALSKLANLKLLDLSSCYNLLSIPDEILEMKDLKIKIGDVTSRASEVVFVKVPKTESQQKSFQRLDQLKKRRLNNSLFVRPPLSIKNNLKFRMK